MTSLTEILISLTIIGTITAITVTSIAETKTEILIQIEDLNKSISSLK